MRAGSHRRTTALAHDLAKEYIAKAGVDPNGSIVFVGSARGLIVDRAVETDKLSDVEFVDVEYGRDNPHKNTAADYNDEAHRSTNGINHTGFNHMIDIRKGPGIYDDFDGYSYSRGSASVEEYEWFSEGAMRNLLENGIEDIEEAAGSFLLSWVHLASEFAWLFDRAPKFDELMNWWLNDEYVHVPGRKWYRPGECSPAMERYSYFGDHLGQRQFAFLEDEMQDRFPLATSTGETRRGIPWSVFLPLDNMGRYWYEHCGASGWPSYVGHTLHAVQDACIPHHAAGTMGNWHGTYEKVLDTNVVNWIEMGPKEEGRPILAVKQELRERAKAYVDVWLAPDDDPPTRLYLGGRERRPAINWRVDHLITWMALHAYHEYATTYNHFRNGSAGLAAAHPESQAELTAKALAISTLILVKIQDEYDWQPFVANLRSKELHRLDCAWVGLMASKNKHYVTMRGAQEVGYDGCHFCQPRPSED